MVNISRIDKNFLVDTNIERDGLQWYDPRQYPFTLHGLLYDNLGYKRMDSDVAQSVSEGIFALHRHTSGGRLSFETDSPYLAIYVRCGSVAPTTMPLTGYTAFDLYLDGEDGLEFTNVFVPVAPMRDTYQGIFHFGEPGTHKVLLHFPLYNHIDEFYIGLDRTSNLQQYSPYTLEKPIVYYGSSITQGGCVSRPGNCYPAIVSRILRRDYWNFGFSGSAHGENEMAEYIASLPMSAFVLDYDHNDCDNLERLSEKHGKFYETVRKAHPDIPIIIMSAPYAARTFFNKHPAKSVKIVYKTYLDAKSAGDCVHFIDCGKLFGENKDVALVDRIHPGDVGHLILAHAVIKSFREFEIVSDEGEGVY